MSRYPAPERGPHLNFHSIVSKRMAARRRALDMTQQQVGDYLGVSREMITRVETNRAELGADDMPALAMALRVPISYFYSLTDPKDVDLILADSLKGGGSAEEVRAVASALAVYINESSGAQDQEFVTILGALDPDYREALRGVARTLYELQLKRPPTPRSDDDGTTVWATPGNEAIVRRLLDVTTPEIEMR